MSEENLITDLDSTISAAVNARIEAEVTKALSGDEVIGQFVAMALSQPVKKKRDNYSHETEPFITHVLRDAIQAATKQAVARLITEEVESIEDEVRKALRRDLRSISETLTKSLVEAAEKPYGVDVNLALKMPSRYQ